MASLSTQSSSPHYTGYYTPSSPSHHYRGSSSRGNNSSNNNNNSRGSHERTALMKYGVPPAGSDDLARFCDKLVHDLYKQRIFPDLHNIKHRVAEIVLSNAGSHHLTGFSSNRKNTWVSSPSLEKSLTRMIQYYAAPSQAAKYAVIADPQVTHTYREANPFPLIVDHAPPDAVALEVVFARITKSGQNCCVLFRETPVVSPAFDGSFYFVSPHAGDIYDKAMWDAFRLYLDEALQNGRRDLYIFPKGRYSCAHALEARKLPFFNGLTMGHLINVVQLAMSKYNLLMFDEDKSIRPPQAAQKVIRSQQRKPSEDSKLYQRDGGPFIGNLEELKFCLKVIFQIENCGSISMCREKCTRRGSNLRSLPGRIKNMISQYCHRQLSETKFGESRLSDLMARPELQDTVELVRTCGSTPWLNAKGAEETSPQLLIRPSRALVIPAEPLTNEVVSAWSRSRRLPSPEPYQHRPKSPSGLQILPPLEDAFDYRSSPAHASSNNSMISVMTPAAVDNGLEYSSGVVEGGQFKVASPWFHQGQSTSYDPEPNEAVDDESIENSEMAALNDVLSQLVQLVTEELENSPTNREKSSGSSLSESLLIPEAPAAPASLENAQQLCAVGGPVPENSDELLLSPTKMSLLRELLELHDGTGDDDAGGLFVQQQCGPHQAPYSTRFNME